MNHTLLQKYLDENKFPHYTDGEITEVQKYLLTEDFERQMYICIEEISELTKEITKTLRGKRNNLGLNEEIADVFICIKILSLIPNNNANTTFQFSLDDLLREYRDSMTRDNLFTKLQNIQNAMNGTCAFLLDKFEQKNRPKYPDYIGTINRNIKDLKDSLVFIMDYFDINYSSVRAIINIKIDEVNKRIKLFDKTKLSNYFDEIEKSDNRWRKPFVDPYLSYDNFRKRIFKEYEEYGQLIIALDFDDTINDFHEKNYTYDYVINLVKWFATNNHARVVIFTASKEDRYKEIEDKCKELELKIEGINVNLIPGQGGDKKIYANVYLDDRAGLGYAYRALYELYEKITKNKNNKILHI